MYSEAPAPRIDVVGSAPAQVNQALYPSGVVEMMPVLFVGSGVAQLKEVPAAA